MEQFPDVEHVYDYAQKQAEASYIRFRKEESEEMREKKEGTWKSWFKSWL
jgi:outer membrane protein assembly factor BamD